MSILTHESMTNHHVAGVWASLAETFHTWRQRYRSRQELSQWSQSRGEGLQRDRPYPHLSSHNKTETMGKNEARMAQRAGRRKKSRIIAI